MFEKPTYEELEQRIQEIEREFAMFKRAEEDRRFFEIRHSLIEYASKHTLEELLTQSLDEVSALVKSPIGFYHFVESDQKTLSLQQWSTRTLKEFCRAKGKGMHYGINQAGVWVDCVYARKPVIHNDYASLSHKKGLPEGHAPVMRELVVPVMRDNKVVAILGVGNKPTEYEQRDVEIVSYLADVTWEIVRRKRAEEALLSEKLLSEEYINSLPGLFYVLDDKRFVKWNSEWNRITGYSDEEMAIRYGTDFFEGKDRSFIGQQMRKVFQEGAAEGEAELITKDGRRIPYYFTGLLKKLNGKDHLIGLAIDITYRKRAEAEKQRLQDQLQQSYKMEAIGTLAGGIAHKFNNYLCGISGNIELLKMANPSIKNINNYADKMLASVQNMANLSNQLLAYAEGGKYHSIPISLGELIDNTFSIITYKLPSSIRVEKDIPADIFTMEGDQTQIQMMLRAITENAAEAIGDKGQIKIVARKAEVDEKFATEHIGPKAGSYVCLKVIDDGKGMDEETKRRIFEPFFTTNFQGRGLGMAAVYGIVKNHNGWIDIESEPGKGTTVSIYFPAVAVQPHKTNAPKTGFAKGMGTILLIEDDQMVLDVGRAMIGNMGYKVLTAKCGDEAILVAKTFKGNIDGAFLDMVLPDIGGKELYTLLMEIRPNLKVIVCSGYSIDSPAQDVLDAGAQAFIQKPFAFEELSVKLKQMTDRRKHKRLKVKSNAVAMFKSNPLQQSEIVDISKDGLSCCYVERGNHTTGLNEPDELSITLVEEGFYSDHMPCKTISDFTLPDDAPLECMSFKRRSIQFGKLTAAQRDQLAHFIENHTIAV